ncbi:hypothetical protein ACQPYH_22965 [Kribbella sp. CA-245084]|uniref:hypothetical protein n=1 Tax=Kribbella sp. CA-245084 TaxID=3239940 RepID=UPI003D91B295
MSTAHPGPELMVHPRRPYVWRESSWIAAILPVSSASRRSRAEGPRPAVLPPQRGGLTARTQLEQG